MKKALCVLIAVLMLVPLAACGSGRQAVTLNILNWGDYIDPEILDQFTEETGIEVKYSTMTSNEEMLVKLSAADCIYDICFPSDYVIEKLVAQDLLHPLNRENIPNLANIDERFLDLSFDPGNTYSVPYMWGTVGILYNTTMVEEPVDSWGILWDTKYQSDVFMLDSIRDSMGITLKYLGYSMNSREVPQLMEAKQKLI